MHRPLREPLYLRVWRLVRGLLFYNTVYWKKASDGLNLPTLTPEERERQRPERNLDIIRPRVRPRAHIEAARGGELSVPQSLATVEGGAVEAYPGEQSVPVVNPMRPAQHGEAPAEDDGTEQVYIKRRRYRRRLVSGGTPIDRGSFIARVFGKK